MTATQWSLMATKKMATAMTATKHDNNVPVTALDERGMVMWTMCTWLLLSRTLPYSRRRGSITSASCFADFTGWRPLSASLIMSQFWSTNANMVWLQCTCVTNYVDQQTLNPDDDYVSGCSTYSSVHCRWQGVSCCSRSSVEQSSITRHCCPPSLSLHLLLSSVQFPRNDSSYWTIPAAIAKGRYSQGPL